MTISFPKLKRDHIPLIGLLSVQLLVGILMAPLNNFSGIYLNEVLLYPLPQVANVIALATIVSMLASIVSGSLSDRWGHKWMLFFGLCAITISSLRYVVDAPWLVIGLWCVASVGMGFTGVSGQGYLTLASSAGLLGLSSALFNWGYTVGGSIGIPLATVVLGTDHFTRLGIALLAFGLLTTFSASFLPVLRSVPSKNAETNSSGYDVLLRRDIALLALLRFLPTCYYGVTTLFPLLIKQQSGSNVTVAWYVTASSIVASIVQLIAGRAADRYGVRLPTQISFITILVAIVGTLFTAQSIWGLYIFGILGISAAWALSTLLPGMMTTVAEPEIRGRVFGMLHVVWASGITFGTLLGGNLLEIDMRLPFIVVGILNIIALGLTVPFFKMAKQSSTM
jgi:MFS family permease